ncbi:lung seven transmembrane receptor-domain-containing protein [Cristinia sonorae]|uniref:Lung seven transmembrane receptor-domain-containing protein n=1 Tax=Cristinia sonorae TaxID=1940300 RepID=A0A8K0ULT5_9AGAR|nr:lung seven transmembrane receptor-domain-containing protein [Cristinia sonorae]
MVVNGLRPFLLVSWVFLVLNSWVVNAFEVAISDTDSDYERQICSGMWAGSSTYINVTFQSGSDGQLAMLVYEWNDVGYLGKMAPYEEDVPPHRVYVCTSDASRGGYCDKSQLGQFIINVPSDKSLDETSFWHARVSLSSNSTTPSGESSNLATNGFWDNPEGNPHPPDEHSEYTSPFRKRHALPHDLLRALTSRQDGVPLNPSPSGTLHYTQPIQYKVRKTGYYCVAVVPFTVLNRQLPRQAPTDVEFHPRYQGTVLFQNTFNGKLPATDYPKVDFYFAMFIVYTVVAAGWAWLCYQNLQDLLPIQYYLSSLLGLVIVEMVANWAYYRYLNAHGKGTTSTVFLIVVAILDAGRNALSFFLLLVVSLGLSVVRESLGRTMLRCQILAGLHFIFGVLYAIGIVELRFENANALVLLLFVIPLAFTLSGFLLWILHSLNATIAQLAARKQRYKLRMFKWLYRILMFTVGVIVIFFIVSSFVFSGRRAEDYGARSWKIQWWLLDGWLTLLYLIDFTAISYLWRPSPNNRRLAMFDEIAQDEEDAEDYDMEALERRTEARGMGMDDDAITLVDRGPGAVHSDEVVFEIGDDGHDGSDDEDSVSAKKRRGPVQEGPEHEREGLMRDE